MPLMCLMDAAAVATRASHSLGRTTPIAPARAVPVRVPARVPARPIVPVDAVLHE